MIYYYLDASAWVKRYYEEDGSAKIQELFSSEARMVSSWLGNLEVLAALHRKMKSGELPRIRLKDKLILLKDDWNSFVQMQIDEEIFELAKTVIQGYALRGSDALHLASALRSLGTTNTKMDQLFFVASDKELIKAAESVKLAVIDPRS
jgi:uncharacterized protein